MRATDAQAAPTTSGACRRGRGQSGWQRYGGSQDARGDAGHGVFLLLALSLGGLRLALSLALRCPRLAFRFLFRGLLLTLGFLLGRLLRLFLLLGKLRLLRLKLGPLCRESAIGRFR